MTKIKPLTKEQLLIALDRLTRFKNPEIKYLRVFKEIITGNLMMPKFKKTELDKMPYERIRNLAQEIINFSLCKLNIKTENDGLINQRLYEYETNTFNLNNDTETLLKNNINYKGCLELIGENPVLNLKWLQHLSISKDITTDRENYSLRWPVEKVIIAEGITEETLLPEFARIAGYDFDKNGVYIISAGGKNQVVKLFYKLSKELKIPIFILMDNDAEENFKEITPRLRPFDSVHILKCGEFEDALPLELMNRTLANTLKNISMPEFVTAKTSMVKILEEIFRHKGMHEFKKSEFAQMVKENLQSEKDISPEIAEIINKIKQMSAISKVVVDN